MHKENTDDIRKLFVGLDKKISIEGKGRVIPINFDNAATTPPFKRVMKKVLETSEYYGSIARGDGQKSQYCSDLYDDCRKTVLEYFNAPKEIYEAVFVSNATDGLNMLSNILIESQEDVVIATRMEHHSNDLPWRGKCDLKYVDVDEKSRLKLEELEALLEAYKEKVRVVTVTGASNVTGYINDIKKIARMAHKYGAKLVVDGAQLVPHKRVSMIQADKEENIDFLVFSAHKMYAPFGSGAVIGLREGFNDCCPDVKGGGTVQIVLDDKQLWLNTPERNEAGTPNLFGVVAMAEAMKEIDRIGFENIESNEKYLMRYIIDGLKQFNRVNLYADNENINDRLGIIVFNINGMTYEDVGEKLALLRGIAIRQGGFCSHPYTRRVLGIETDDLQRYMSEIGTPGMVRLSLGMYNTKKEADIFLETIQTICRRYIK